MEETPHMGVQEAPPQTAQMGLRLVQLKDLLTDWEADARAAAEAYITKTPRGPVTSYPTLDRELGGALAPGLHIVHGSPGVGKTAFALQVGTTCGCPCLYISCEMGALELFRRVTARVTDTYLGKFKTGELPPDFSLDKAKKAAEAASSFAILDATRAWASAAVIQQLAEGVKGDHCHLLIIVDSIHSWIEGSDVVGNEYELLNLGLGSLRKIAQTLDCPIIAVAERNRANMKTGGLSAGAGSRKIEYGAESVFDLNRDEDAKRDTHGEADVTLTLAKNRNGSPGYRIKLKFNGALQRFREV